MPTPVLDTADWRLAVPLTATGGTPIDFSGSILTAAASPPFGGGAVATASSADGSLTFVPTAGSLPAHFTIDLPVAGRTWRASAPTTLFADVMRQPDPAHPAIVEWIGRVAFVVHPGSGSSGIAQKRSAPALIPVQPFDPYISTGPLVVGPQGPAGALPALPPDAGTVDYVLTLVGGVLTWVASGSSPTPSPGFGVLDFSNSASSGLLAALCVGIATSTPSAPSFDFSTASNSGYAVLV